MSTTIMLWPGLNKLWHRGEIYSLVVSILFGMLLNLAILSTFYWVDWIPVAVVRGIWIATFLTIGWSFLSQYFGMDQTSGVSPVECDRLFATAQKDYLRGEYVEAEASLHPLLNRRTEDVEAALLLATIFRRTGRFRQATDCLDRISRLDSGSAWMMEISSERKKLVEIENHDSMQTSHSPDGDKAIESTVPT